MNRASEYMFALAAAVCSVMFLAGCREICDCSAGFERKIIDGLSEEGEVVLSASDIAPVECDSMYIVEGLRFSDEVEEIVGMYYGGGVRDGDRLYLFMRNGQIVRDVASYCPSVDYRIFGGNGFAVLYPYSQIKVTMFRTGPDASYRVEWVVDR